MAHDGAARRGLVEGRQFEAASVMPTGQGDDGLAAKQLGQTAGLDLRGVIPGQQHTHRGALALDHRVGGQGSGQGDQSNLLQQIGRQLVQRTANAHCQVKTRRQTLGRGYHLLVGVQQDGIGEGAASVDTQKKMHVTSPCSAAATAVANLLPSA